MLYVSSASLSISQIFCTSATEILTQIVKYKDNTAQRILGDSASPKDNNGEKEPLVMSATRKQWMKRINGQTNAQNIRGVGVQGHVQACSFSLPLWLYLSPSLSLLTFNFSPFLSLFRLLPLYLSFSLSFPSLARTHTHAHSAHPNVMPKLWYCSFFLRHTHVPWKRLDTYTHVRICINVYLYNIYIYIYHYLRVLPIYIAGLWSYRRQEPWHFSADQGCYSRQDSESWASHASWCQATVPRRAEPRYTLRMYEHFFQRRACVKDLWHVTEWAYA